MNNYLQGLNSGIIYRSEHTGLPLTIALCEVVAFDVAPDPIVIVAASYDVSDVPSIFMELRTATPFVIEVNTINVIGNVENVQDDHLNSIKQWVVQHQDTLIALWNMHIDFSELEEILFNAT